MASRPSILRHPQTAAASRGGCRPAGGGGPCCGQVGAAAAWCWGWTRQSSGPAGAEPAPAPPWQRLPTCHSHDTTFKALMLHSKRCAQNCILNCDQALCLHAMGTSGRNATINVKRMHAALESDTDLSDQPQPLQNQTLLQQAMQQSQCHLIRDKHKTGWVVTAPASTFQCRGMLLDFSLEMHHLLFKVAHGVAAILGSFQQALGSLQCCPCSPFPSADCFR